MNKAHGSAGRRVLAVLCALALLLPLCRTGAAARTRDGGPGGLTHYNALLFDHFESVHGYMEGALAARGTALFGSSSGSYDAGLAAERAGIGVYRNPDGMPTLLLGSAPVVGMTGYSNCTVYGGPVAMGADAHAVYAQSAQKFRIRDEAGLFAVGQEQVVRWFDDAYNAVAELGQVLAFAHSDEQVGDATVRLNDFVSWNAGSGAFDRPARFEPDNLDSGGMRVLVIVVADEEHAEIISPRLSAAFADYDQVVLHFPNASSVRFTGPAVQIDDTQLNPNAAAGTADNDRMARWAEKLVWHFPRADAVQIAGHGVIGSLVAPHAYVEGSGGLINGMLIADSLLENGGMHLSAFALDERVFDWVNRDGDHPLTGEVRVYKYDETAGGRLLLGDAVFALWQRNSLGVWETYGAGYRTSVDGMFAVDGLPEGDYFFLETGAPYGYELSGERQYFTVDAGHGVESPLILRIPGRRILVPIEARKMDADTGAGLAGAQFQLYAVPSGPGRGVEVIAELESGADGALETQALGYGNYRLVELAPPDGYESRLGDWLDLRIDGDVHGNVSLTWSNPSGPVALDPDEVIELPNRRVEDDSAGKRLVVEKLDLDDPDTPLDGAVFTLELREPGGDWQMLHNRLVTDAYGLFEVEDLPDAEYRLTEIEPSVGYRMLEEAYVFRLSRADTTVVELFDRANGRITVEKVDAEDPDRKLAGAQFTLYYDGGGNGRAALGALEEVASGETGADGLLHFEHLKPGRYYVVQTAAPDGYRPIESPELAGSAIVSFLLDANGDKVLYPEEVALEVQAEPDMATVTVHKVDGAVYHSAGYTPAHGLPGARFDLYRLDAEEHTWQRYRRDIRVTRADGRVEIAELPPAVYKLVETAAPTGYRLHGDPALDELMFAVQSGDGALDEELVVENEKAPVTGSRMQGERVFDLPLYESDNPDTGRKNRVSLLWAAVLLFAARRLWRSKRR